MKLIKSWKLAMLWQEVGGEGQINVVTSAKKEAKAEQMINDYFLMKDYDDKTFFETKRLDELFTKNTVMCISVNRVRYYLILTELSGS